MKNLFSWRLRPSEADFAKLWEDATFVFDTNFLLDLYRVSRTTSEDFLLVLERLQNRIWLPYQVANEFLENRESTIRSEASSFQEASKIVKKWKDEQKSFQSLRGQLKQTGRVIASEIESFFGEHDSYLESVDLVEKYLREKIEKIANSHPPIDPNEDYILDKILSLFDGKVGNRYDGTALQKLYREGEERYSRGQPPGFEDAKAKEDERKYGDLTLWKQVLDFAKTESSPVIFITGEKKRDWWTGEKGETISPHLELRYEFYEQVNQPFWMYPTQVFLKMAKKRLVVKINPRSIEETDAIAVEAVNKEAFADKQAYYDKMRQLTDLPQLSAINSALLKAFAQSQLPVINSALLKALDLPQLPVIDSALLKALAQSQLPFPTNVKDLKNQKVSQAITNDANDLKEIEQLAEEIAPKTLRKEKCQLTDEVDNRDKGKTPSGTNEIPHESKQAKPDPKKPPKKRHSGNVKKPDAGNSC
ncbi:DUF4935 domain-containing protein [Phormidium sp. CLA17]|uniref:PIN-like domain-containing protein n=1 Tax=Leptolyngbya sp. Cla-17 TaxID=2803751 RepID=UPI00149315F0|nr:PIN domain-containing protein [Leptolyngbya sp. Cla-17]MBM0743533.1 DUF4935 domain-containing protein [Leptolyngbya sp. Cla-17]